MPPLQCRVPAMRTPAAPELIETARLVLRRPRPNDADAIYARYAGDPAVTTFLAFPTHRSIDDARAFVQFSDAEWERWSAGPYVIRSRSDQRLIGGTGLSVETPYRAATGYVLARDSWGQGFATEALRAMVALADHLGLARVHAFCHPQHGASRRVLEKCGFVCEGTWRRYAEFPNRLPAGPADVLCYAICPEAPPAASGARGPTRRELIEPDRAASRATHSNGGVHMTRRLISSGSSFEHEIGYSRAVVDGDWIFVSGTTGFDYRTMTIAEGIVAQTEQCLRNIAEALHQAGASLVDVVRVMYVVPDAREFSKCWPVLRAHFGETRPAATMIAAGLADPRMAIEIQVTARRTRNLSVAT
jgi:RimJ/RimL family protein N-acetyltransferase/enamine deaminase RidA (YjgF/YER057c/UK114 family)